MDKIALFGGAGVIGRSIARALSAAAVPYRVVGRDPAALTEQFGADPLAELQSWNPDDPASVERAAAGVDTIVYLVGVDYWRFDLHPQLMRKTLDGALAAGVKHMVLIGTVYPYGRVGAGRITESQPRNPHTFKGRMRKAQEDLLLAADARGEIHGTVLRLPDFYGPHVAASLLHGAATAAVRGGVADMIGPIDRPHEFVFVPDVGPVVAKLIETPAAYGKVWHLAGAGVTTQLAMLEAMQLMVGHPIRRRVVGKQMLRLIGLFKPFMREMVEMHYLVTDPVVMDDSALQSLIGPIHKTSYADGLRQTLAAVKTG